MNYLASKLLLITAIIGQGFAAQPQALVYRGPAACEGCAESVAHILKTSASRFNVTYVGPNEDVDITSESLSKADAYCQPGGGDLAPSWNEMKKYKQLIRDFVSNGGRYMGFCVGAYLAGPSQGFDLVPQGDSVTDEMFQPGAQVKNEKDTIINVDWHFATGVNAGRTQDKRWLYFQDGAVMKIGRSSNVKILGRYSSNSDIAGTLSPFGRGWVGLVGPHPEATDDWCKWQTSLVLPRLEVITIPVDALYNLTNPDGVNLDIAYDFVETTFHGFDDTN